MQQKKVQNKPGDHYDVLMQYALKLIARKRYTEKEISIKLKNKKIGRKKDRDKVIKRLIELKYVDDKEFARDYISNRLLLNPRGRRLLKLELKIKGIGNDIIEKALEKANINEIEYAKKALERKKKYLDNFSGQKRKEKTMSFLASRGFAIETIYKILESC